MSQQQQRQIRATIPNEEWIALQAFYESTNGNYWNYHNKGSMTNTTHWNFSSYNNNNPCFDQWAGIVCTCHHYNHPHYYSNYYTYSYYFSTSSVLKSQCNIQKLVLINYNLTGTITYQIKNFKNITILIAHRNNIYGTLPTEFGLLKTIKKIGFAQNKLTGTIPSSLGNLNQLRHLNLQLNSLTGTIPSSLGNLNQLQYLYLQHNYLTGTIPSSLGNLDKLHHLYLEFNSLTGTIPSSLGNLNQLYYLYLDANFLTGTIPSSLGNIDELHYLYLDYNYLTGKIPTTFGDLKKLQYLALDYNSLTGIIPSSLGNLDKLYYLELHFNCLTGTIPSSLGNLQKLQKLYLDSNSLTGTFPLSLRNLTSLIILLLYSNQLQGDIRYVFNSTLQTNLTIIQINNNQLTGNLPEEIFKLPNLQTFDAVSNCFSGDIPYSTICKSKTITNLILDGLHTATSCRQQIFPGSSLLSSSSYTLKNNIFNKLDYCLFKMQSLSTLHLSGNGLTGTLPNYISNSLTDLSISHNLFTGVIPNSFQLQQWNNLDLSYNRIAGTLLSDFSSQKYNSSLVFQQNRLSGLIPSSLIQLTSINVLSGNIFNCDLTKSNIPQCDSNISNYSCGSSTFDISYFIWLGIIFSLFCFILSILIFRFGKTIDKNRYKTELFSSMIKIYNSDLNLSSSFAHDDRSIITNKLIFLMKKVLSLVIYIITILLTIYTVSGSYFGTYSNQYAWTVSIAFQSGTIAFGLTFTALCVLILFLLSQITKTNNFGKIKQNNNDLSFDQEISTNKNQTMTEMKSNIDFDQKIFMDNIISSLKWTITPLINVLVVGGVNILYVFLFLLLSRNVIVILQILLASFKSFWNGFGYKYLNQQINRRYNVDNKSLRHFSLQLFVRLLNNIMIPCIVVAMINKNCFYNLIVPPPVVSSQYNYEYCNTFNNNNVCTQHQIKNQVTIFDPPYTYSYQCSSQFITFYSVAFVFLCIIDGLVVPLGQIIIVKLYNYGITNNRKWVKLLRNIMPRILKLDRIDNNKKMERDKFRPYFDSLQLYLNNFTYLGLIMTFGAVFPPLAASFFITIVIMNYSFLFKVERFVNYANEKNKKEYVELINEECGGCFNKKLLMRSVWMIITISCLFYSLFLFDTLGDAVGLNGAYWVLIVMPLFPLITYIGYRVSIVICSEEKVVSANDSDNNNNRESTVEIIIIGNPLRQISTDE